MGQMQKNILTLLLTAAAAFAYMVASQVRV